MKCKIFATLLVAMLLGGCAGVRQPHFQVFVDSLAAPDAQQKRRYLLLPGNEGVTENDLQFQEYAAYVNRVLTARGFVETDDFGEAEVAVVLSYGIGEPKTTQYSYSLPVWGQTGISSSQTYGTATTYGNSASYSGTTTYTPSYGVTGYTSHIGSQTTYFRYVVLTGYDLDVYRAREEQVEVWQTKITSTGSSGDLRRVFPVLIGAAVPHLVTNTGKQVPVRLYETDGVVRSVRGEAVEP